MFSTDIPNSLSKTNFYLERLRVNFSLNFRTRKVLLSALYIGTTVPQMERVLIIGCRSFPLNVYLPLDIDLIRFVVVLSIFIKSSVKTKCIGIHLSKNTYVRKNKPNTGFTQKTKFLPRNHGKIPTVSI